jgi:predicted Zn-dependent protease
MKPSLVVALALIMTALFSVDVFLARLERQEIRNEAQSLFEDGERLIASGHADRGIVALQRAHQLMRSERRFQLALARGLLAAGRLTQAGAHLVELLERNSNDGPTNLTMARLQAKQGNEAAAEAYYHRAIYGTWPPGNPANLSVRLELADFLAGKNKQQQLLSELLLLSDPPPSDPQTTRRVAQLFIAAGAPERAAQIFRSLIRKDPTDVAAHVGLAEAELVEGDFRSAQSSLRNAARLVPDDRKVAERLELASQLSALDPTPRRLTSGEKYSRSSMLLALTRDALAECELPAERVPGITKMLDEAGRALKARGIPTNERAEHLLELAGMLWRERPATCRRPAGHPDLLSLMMLKVEQ